MTRERPHAPFVLRDAMVMDAAGGFSAPVDVAVRDGRIARVGRNVSAGDAVSVDAAGLWLMPGVFDCHDHLGFSSLDPSELLRTPITQWTLETARNLRHTLECGVTFVRDAAGVDAGIKEAVERGYVDGPRLQISVVGLSETGGHWDGFLRGPGWEMSADYVMPDYPGRPPYLVDGVDDMRRVVRQVLRAGADWIKICTTGGVASPYDDGELPQLTFDEVRVAVEEAARKGKRVMAHAFGGEGLDNAIAAGVATIEHGIFLTEEQARAMAAAGCSLVPTLAILRDCVRWAEEAAMPSYAVDKTRALSGVIGDAVAIAREHGVRIALGTDFVHRDQHGRNLEEIVLLHEAGLTVEESLLAATTNGAQLCGVACDYGCIAPGYVFDAIAFDDDPSDLQVFGRRGGVTGVWQAGHPVVPHERLTGA